MKSLISGRRSRGIVLSEQKDVRTLRDFLHAGSNPGAIPLWRTAEFSGPLQHRADPADPDRAPCRWQAVIRPDALGAVAVLGRGTENLSAPHQCARRIRARQAGL